MQQSQPDKPSPGHVAWSAGDDGSTTMLAPAALTEWAERMGHDLRRPKELDEERADEPRHQLRVVFCWEPAETETLTMGECRWELGEPKQPATFLEIDTEGMVRVQTWDESVVIDMESLRIDEDSLVMTGEEFFGEKTLNGTELAESEPPADRETSTFW